jgi:hypothetical protein
VVRTGCSTESDLKGGVSAKSVKEIKAVWEGREVRPVSETGVGTTCSASTFLTAGAVKQGPKETRADWDGSETIPVVKTAPIRSAVQVLTTGRGAGTHRGLTSAMSSDIEADWHFVESGSAKAFTKSVLAVEEQEVDMFSNRSER